MVLAAEIVEDIFDLTERHPGLVGLCGEFIDLVATQYKLVEMSFQNWIKSVRFNLPRLVVESATYSAIIQFIFDQHNAVAVDCYRWLSAKFALGPEVIVSDADDPIVDMLDSYGLIVIIRTAFKERRVKFAAPILYTIWLSSATISFENIPLFQVNKDLKLNCIDVIHHYIQMVSFKTLKASESQNVNGVQNL
eukprot:TRINITY_DN5524_c0_g3_i3.p1 TRINITY_DN5524_c0_g3~~TRINITY_DN5524_c0_g3_i3.p1  ORF type:complete len:193 (+),score=12.50 TRINITY_DN5524_c0_g3_i3:179-757(+)